jgi:hypothetical protein
MTPDLQHAALDGRRDASGAVDGVDRRHVVAVSLFDRCARARSIPSDVPDSANSMS